MLGHFFFRFIVLKKCFLKFFPGELKKINKKIKTIISKNYIYNNYYNQTIENNHYYYYYYYYKIKKYNYSEFIINLNE
jgi:hypothetical protein